MGSQNHHPILVETATPSNNATSKDQCDYIYQVKGNIQAGMTYEHRLAREDDVSLDKKLLGTVAIADFERVDGICQGVPVPKKQFAGPRRLYPREPLRRRQEWTKDALEALETAGVLTPARGEVTKS